MRNYIILNDVNSNTINGLLIQELPPISKPKMRTQIEEIDGRAGDIVTQLGYAAYTKTISVGLYGDFDIDEVISYFNSSGTVVFSNEPDKYYNYEIIDQIDFNRLVRFRTAKVKMHVQPFKYPTEEEPLVAQYQLVTNTGSDMSLDNTANALFRKLDLKGNTSQETTQGLNYFNALEIPNSSGIVVEDEGKTIKMPISESGNGYTSTGKTLSQLCPTIIVGDEVWLNFTRNLTDVNKMIYLNGADDLWSIGAKRTITQTMLDSIVALYGNRASSGETSQCILTNFRITKLSGDIWEKFSYGASPNPSYPQDIKVVTGDNKIRICGKNLASNKWEDYKMYDASYAVMPVKLEIGATYKLTATRIGELKGQYYNYGIVKDGDRYANFVGLQTCVDYSTGNTANITITPTSDWKNPKLVCYCNGNPQGKFEELMANYNIQLEKSDSVTDYEPYKGTNYSINLPISNILDITDGTYSDANVEAVVSNGEITLNGTSNANAFINIPLSHNLVLTNGEKYTISGNNPVGNVNVKIRINTSGTYDTALTNINGLNTITYDSSVVIYGNKIVIRLESGKTFTNFKIKPQIEVGEKSNSYWPYGTTPIKLCKIGDYEDKPFKAVNGDETYDSLTDAQKEALTSGSWYKYGAIGKVVLDSSKFNEKGTTGTNAYYISTTIADGLNDNTIASSMSDKFGMVAFNNRQNGLDVTYVQNGRIYIRTKNNTSLDWSTNQNCKDWLDANTPLIRYISATPTFTELTDEDLIAQLEALKQANSYDGQTNISHEYNGSPFILDVAAVQKGTDTLVVNNEGNIYARPTLDIEGTGMVNVYLEGNQMFQVDLSENNEIVIDTDEMEAYDPSTQALMNRQVTGNYDNFKIVAGNNNLKFSGDLTKATVTNYERWL